MSLFGNLGQNKPVGSSLFGNATNTTSQAGSSLFGAPTSSQPQQQSSILSNRGGSTQPQTTNLFGNLGSNQPQQQASSGGLFSGLGASTTAPQQPTSGGLFGAINTSQGQQNQATTGGLFGNLGTNPAQPQQQSSGGLFGASTQPQQQHSTGGLFGGLGTTQTQQPSTSSLFGGLGTSQPQQQQSTTGGLFGDLVTSQPQQQQATNASLFGSSVLDNAPGSQVQGQTQQQNGQLGAVASQPAYFDHLLERGKKRNNEVNGGNQLGDLPSLQLGLADIARKARNLGNGGPSALEARAGESRAHYLLAASGVSTGSAIRDLNSFAAQAAASSAPPPSAGWDTDIDGYVMGLQKQSTLDLIAESLEQSKRDFDAFLEDNVQMEWDAQRRRIYEHFGLAKPKDDLGGTLDEDASPGARAAFGRSTRRGKGLGASAAASTMSFGASSLSKSVIGAPSAKGAPRASLFADVADKSSDVQQLGSDNRFVRDKQEEYAEKVKQLNESRLQEIVYPVLQQFASVESQAADDNSSQFVDAYTALVKITGERADVQRPSDPGAVKERQYAPAYLDETPNSAQSIAIQKRIINGSRTFLEEQYFNQLQSIIAKNPKEANLGGVPSTVNKVRAYIRLRTLRKDLGVDTAELQTLGDDYCWVLIFTLLRSGLVREAAQYVQENERAIKSMDRNFPVYIASYVKDKDRRLRRDLQTKINAEYQQRSRIAPEDSLDPYRMACYKVIGRCELSRRNLEGLNQNFEDWIWLQFALAREANRVEEGAGEVFGLDDVRSVIHDIGQRHFTQGSEGNSGFATYFFLQILSGMFEQAIAYLYPHDYVAAVHFAIALDFYGLLRVADFAVSESDLLTFTTRQKPQISFARMLGYYTQDFRAAKPEAAADYLTLICLNSDLGGSAGQSQTSVCHEALRELVLETREFAQLLGDIRTDGQRIRGAIEQRLKLINLPDQEAFLRTVTIQAAAVADDSGRTTDAVLLYHLAEQYDDVIVIINRVLSESIAVDVGQEQMRLQPLKPRSTENEQQSQQKGRQQQLEQDKQPESSFSLTAVDTPEQLAVHMTRLYNKNAMYYQKIRQQNRETCGILLQLVDAKNKVQAGRWVEALDTISGLELLPLKAQSSIAVIRASAQTFNSLSPVLARTIGSVLMWTITCCGRQREVLRNATFEDKTRQEMSDNLLTMARDLMVFAGLVRYKLPARVFEALARAGGDFVDS